jgi:hypothetical protein
MATKQIHTKQRWGRKRHRTGGGREGSYARSGQRDLHEQVRANSEPMGAGRQGDAHSGVCVALGTPFGYDACAMTSALPSPPRARKSRNRLR